MIDGFKECECGWRQYHNGIRWRVRESGVIEVEGEGILRTEGNPRTAETNWLDYRANWLAAQEEFSVPVHIALSVMLVEAWPPFHGFHRNPQQDREEPGYTSDEATSHKVSSGIMHTLLSTAQSEHRKRGLFERPPTREDLYFPDRSIRAGVAYLATLAERYGMEPMLLQVGYNAGGVKHNPSDPFGFYVFDSARHRKYIRANNDFLIGVMGAEP